MKVIWGKHSKLEKQIKRGDWITQIHLKQTFKWKLLGHKILLKLLQYDKRKSEWADAIILYTLHINTAWVYICSCLTYVDHRSTQRTTPFSQLVNDTVHISSSEIHNLQHHRRWRASICCYQDCKDKHNAILCIIQHTHTCLVALCPGLHGWASTRKVKPIWILLKQETVSGSGISWAICKSAPCSIQITMPAPHYSVLYRPDALPPAQPTASKHWRQCTIQT